MPVMDDLEQLLEVDRLRSARVIVVHPDDYHGLALELRHEASFDISDRGEITAFGVRLVISRYQQQGHVSVVTEPEGRRPNAPLDLLRMPAVEPFGLGGVGLLRSGAGGDGHVIVEEWSEEQRPPPRTLWELLSEADE